ncbi:hypothetical protein Hdeb2414_s0008g00268171 [Helianthus debilis subsp. tardiflorus]
MDQSGIGWSEPLYQPIIGILWVLHPSKVTQIDWLISMRLENLIVEVAFSFISLTMKT